MSTALMCFVLLLTVVSVLPYDDLPMDPDQSCSIPYLTRRLSSGKHIARILQVFDYKVFNQSCAPLTREEAKQLEIPNPLPNLWDKLSLRPYPKIVIFFHMGLFPTTNEVVEEMIEAFVRSGLLRDASVVNVGISGTGAILPTLPLKFQVVGADHLNSHESISFGAVVRYVQTHPTEFDTRILYLHSKGTFHRQQGSAWRRYLVFFDVWLYRFTLILLQYFETYGVDLHSAKPGHHFGTAGACYLGSFFWANLRYLRLLSPTYVSRERFFRFNRTMGELWPGTGFRLPHMPMPVAQRMFCSVFATNNHYVTEFPAARYTTPQVYLRLAHHLLPHIETLQRLSQLQQGSEEAVGGTVTAALKQKLKGLALPVMHCLVVMPSPYGSGKSRGAGGGGGGGGRRSRRRGGAGAGAGAG